MLKVNETPLRTSRNFGINNIKLEDIDLPTNLKEFNFVGNDVIVIPNTNIREINVWEWF